MVASVVSSTVSTAGKRELSTNFTGETVTVKEMIELSGVSKVTLLKLLSASGIQPVGKVLSGSRGRPAALFDRDVFARILTDRNTAKTTKGKKSTVKVKADASAEPDSDSDSDELSVDQINAMLADI